MAVKNKIQNSNRMIIRDAVDIETDIQDTTPVNKTSLTDSEQVTYSTVDLRHRHLKIFSLLSTSDKEINLRMYPDKHVEDMAKNHKWTTPYAKPLQHNHDIYGDANARFFDSWYLKHSDLKPQHGYGELPQGVIDEFQRRGAFKEGTGSTIGMAETANLDFKKKIIDGTYLTTSQGAATNSLTCNICGSSYRDYANCNHMRGTVYPIKDNNGKIVEMRRCVPFTGELDAIEDSVVNVPANDTSTLLVYDTKKNKVVTMDNISEYTDIFDIKDFRNTGNLSDNKHTGILTDNKDKGLTQKQIDDVKKLINDSKPNENLDDTNLNNKKNEGDTMAYSIKNAATKRVFKDDCKKLNVTDIDKINAYFDGLSDEATETVMGFLDFVTDNKVEDTQLATTTPNPVNDNQHVTIPPTVPPVTDDGTQTKPANKIEDSQEYKDMKKQLEDALAEIAKLKGIDNTVPNLSDIKNTDTKPQTIGGINDFDF